MSSKTKIIKRTKKPHRTIERLKRDRDDLIRWANEAIEIMQWVDEEFDLGDMRLGDFLARTVPSKSQI